MKWLQIDKSVIPLYEHMYCLLDSISLLRERVRVNTSVPHEWQAHLKRETS